MTRNCGLVTSMCFVVCGLVAVQGMPARAHAAATDARFATPQGIAIDSSGNLYVADTSASTIRKIATNGAVTVVAGYLYGMLDGYGAGAMFAYPSGIAVDASGNLFVVDQMNHNVRKITPTAQVTTFAGSPNGTQFGSVDGSGTAARFNQPNGIAIDVSGNLYVADYKNNSLRKITPGAVVSTLATGLSGAAAVAVDASGTPYVACATSGTIAKVMADGSVTVFKSGLNSALGGPQGLAFDPAGNLYVADTGNSVIRMITPGGVMTTIAGTLGSSGSDTDGVGTAATFDFPVGIVLRGANTLYVSDYLASTIRKITISGATATVSTYAGAAYQSGNADSIGGAIPAPAAATWHVALAGLAAIGFLISVKRRRLRAKA